MNTTVDIDVLLSTPDKTYKFYGANCNQFKLGKNVYEAIEDPEDGYRSCLQGLVKVEEPTGIFYGRAIATVILRSKKDSYQDVYELVDVEDGHVWLTFGTNEYDDYYPYFVFEPHPKAP